MDGGIGSSLAVELVAEIILKTINIGIHVIQNSRLYQSEDETIRLRLRIQIGIWRAIDAKLRESEIKKRIRPVDVATYYDIMKTLHKLMHKYVERKCQPGKTKTDILKSTSAAELSKEIEERDILKPLSEGEKAQNWGFWLRLKEEVAWTVWRKEKNERLVMEIEFWGTKLDSFSSWTIPSMFPQPTKEDIAIIADSRLNRTNFKGQLMLAKSASTTVAAIAGLSVTEEGPFIIGEDRITMLEKGFVKPSTPGRQLTEEDIALERERRTELGGIERRQWVKFKAMDGTEKLAIIEFKARPSPEDARFPLGDQYITNEVARLIRTLRTAAQKPETFRVLYCEGWYEAKDHLGLIYRLPSGFTNLKCESLGNILLKQKYKELLQSDLENRLKLAKSLAWTLFELHSVNWVHKSFNPDNILLFGDEVQEDKTKPAELKFDWSSPYLAGFDSSRSTTDESGRLDFRAQWTVRLYTHPNRQLGYERYEKIHDIYSLGVVLLEIGRLGSFMEERRSDKLNKAAPSQLKGIFVEEAKSLRTVLGTAYGEVVLACLNGEFSDPKDDYLLSGEFRSQVCEKLSLIKISGDGEKEARRI